jgi:hypothetical protein
MENLLPIFPLEIVVYPGDELNLHIFEPRYQQLINDTVKTKQSFGIPAVINRKLAGLGATVKLGSERNALAVPLTEAQRDCVFFFVPRRARVKPLRNVSWSRQCFTMFGLMLRCLSTFLCWQYAARAPVLWSAGMKWTR